jgi:uncharacterized protein YggE
MRTVPAAILACLLLPACSSQPAAPDPRGVARDEVLLQVSATGRADERPDQARFTAGVQTIGASAAEASARNSETITKVVAALGRLGVKPDDVQTRSITLSRIGYGANRGKFEANNMVEVRIRDVKRAGEAIAATTDAGANVLSGPNLTVGDPEQAGRSAYAAAYRAARARADAYAQAAGLRVARILAIRDGGDASMEGLVANYAADAAVELRRPASPPPPVAPGVSTREAQVRVEFALAK